MTATISEERLNETFAALANPTRRAILARLAEGEASVNELAAPFEMTLPAVSRHIKVLERAGLVTQGQRAQYRPCTLDPTPLREVSTWTEHYRPIWEARFDRMDAYLQALQAGLDLPAREAEQRVKRVAFGAEQGEILAVLEDLGVWYRDLVLVGAGAESAVVNADRLAELRSDVDAGATPDAEAAAALARQTWRDADEFNLNASLLLEALFVRLRRAFSRTPSAAP
jgi:DNA-binding transcriptional ArsR family regulator